MCEKCNMKCDAHKVNTVHTNMFLTYYFLIISASIIHIITIFPGIKIYKISVLINNSIEKIFI